jgi:NAD(P)-dependent dehydrogenase (short-subunit alcohol dehydrogenase family)
VRRHAGSRVQALFAAAASELGGIDVLVNKRGHGRHRRLHEMTDEQWSIVLDVTNGTFRCTRRTHAHVRREAGDRPNASVMGWRAQAARRITARKAGVMALTRRGDRSQARGVASTPSRRAWPARTSQVTLESCSGGSPHGRRSAVGPSRGRWPT